MREVTILAKQAQRAMGPRGSSTTTSSIHDTRENQGYGPNEGRQAQRVNEPARRWAAARPERCPKRGPPPTRSTGLHAWAERMSDRRAKSRLMSRKSAPDSNMETPSFGVSVQKARHGTAYTWTHRLENNQAPKLTHSAANSRSGAKNTPIQNATSAAWDGIATVASKGVLGRRKPRRQDEPVH